MSEMARLTQCLTVTQVEPEFWAVAPLTYMVRVHAALCAMVATLARLIIALLYGESPSPVTPSVIATLSQCGSSATPQSVQWATNQWVWFTFAVQRHQAARFSGMNTPEHAHKFVAVFDQGCRYLSTYFRSLGTPSVVAAYEAFRLASKPSEFLACLSCYWCQTTASATAIHTQVYHRKSEMAT